MVRRFVGEIAEKIRMEFSFIGGNDMFTKKDRIVISSCFRLTFRCLMFLFKTNDPFFGPEDPPQKDYLIEDLGKLNDILMDWEKIHDC